MWDELDEKVVQSIGQQLKGNGLKCSIIQAILGIINHALREIDQKKRLQAPYISIKL